MMSHTETIYHLSLRSPCCLTACNSMAYAGSGYGMLYRDFAVHGCYEETI